MEVKVLSSTTIPQSQYYRADAREIPLTIFDRLAPDMHIPILYAFKPPNPSNSTLIQGLLKTLANFPVLGAQLVEDHKKHTPRILIGNHGTGGGVLVLESQVQSYLLDHLPLGPSPNITKLYPSMENPTHLLQIQLNRFACGGLVIGVTSHHRVADGFSMSSFFNQWGKAVRGLELSKMVRHGMEYWLQPRCPPKCEFEHWGVDFIPPSHVEHPPHSENSVPSLTKTNWIYVEESDRSLKNVDNVLVHYSASFIKEQLKARVSSAFSRFELVTGHIWKKISQARGLDPHSNTEMRVAVNGRPRFPSAPPHYFGNFVVNAFPSAKVEDILGATVGYSAKIIHDSVGRVDKSYMQSLIDFGELNKEEVLEPVEDQEYSSLLPNLEVDSWLGLALNALDFGCGEQCGFRPGWIPVEGVVVLMPCSCVVDIGGVDVLVTLFEEHAKHFREICYLVD